MSGLRWIGFWSKRSYWLE